MVAPSLTHCFEYVIVYICVDLCLKDYIEEKMVSYLNGELCNILGNLLNRWTSKSVNTSQIYQPLNHSIYDIILLGGSYMKCSIFLSFFICIPSLLVTSCLNISEAYPMHFISKYMPGCFVFRTCGIFLVAQFWWRNDIDMPQGENNMDFYLTT